VKQAGHRGRNGMLLVGGLVAVVAAGVLAFVLIPPSRRAADRSAAVVEPAEDLPVVTRLPDFTLTDHTGAAFGRGQLVGHVTIAGFVFTRCQTVCPLITLRMRKLQEQTRSAGAALQLVSFTVDPVNDTPEVLAAYAAKAGADPARWRFVSGDPAEVRRVVAGAMAMSMDPDGTTQANGAAGIRHSEHLALIDRSGQVRGFYDSTDPDRLTRLQVDAARLLAAP